MKEDCVMEPSNQTSFSFWDRFVTNVTSWRRMSVVSTIIILVAVILLVPRNTPFWQFTVTDVVELLMMLFLVALFVERAVEVIMGAWRGSEKQELQAEVNIQRRRSTEGLAKEEAERAYEVYRAEFRVLSLLVALFIGLVVSALGFRILQALVDPVAFRSLAGWQRALFSCADTFVTGAMIGGGSEGIHRVLDAFLSQFDRWRQYTKDKIK